MFCPLSTVFPAEHWLVHRNSCTHTFADQPLSTEWLRSTAIPNKELLLEISEWRTVLSSSTMQHLDVMNMDHVLCYERKFRKATEPDFACSGLVAFWCISAQSLISRVRKIKRHLRLYLLSNGPV